MTSWCYWEVLKEDFLSFLQGMGVQFEETFFQQVIAQAHTANAILDAIIGHFGDLSQTASVGILAMNGLGHHIIPISSPGTSFYGGI
jgi:hypothetical protein